MRRALAVAGAVVIPSRLEGKRPMSQVLQFVSGLFLPVSTLWTMLQPVVVFVVHVGFAMGVHRDADHRARARLLLFVSPALWSLATLIGGPITAAIYWVVHVSSLAREPICDDPPSPMSR